MCTAWVCTQEHEALHRGTSSLRMKWLKSPSVLGGEALAASLCGLAQVSTASPALWPVLHIAHVCGQVPLLLVFWGGVGPRGLAWVPGVACL